ncbi:hypothetical protein HRW18_17390 [Streptomyces lunaelactis]|uniref:hypothetical protein n=1 Tax=Streptomyces lunaelactis TaxID=1535768 RepID=UPI0015858CF5|nr:hypothetical protein [Streptomyces lunaelactis]NUK09747.1 hypothetical protein [Streptomyces lunaelactis]
MIRHWASIESDLAREYHLDAEHLARLSTRRFLVLLGGLPAESAFGRLWQRTPRTVTDPTEIARLTGVPVITE